MSVLEQLNTSRRGTWWDRTTVIELVEWTVQKLNRCKVCRGSGAFPSLVFMAPSRSRYVEVKNPGTRMSWSMELCRRVREVTGHLFPVVLVTKLKTDRDIQFLSGACPLPFALQLCLATANAGGAVPMRTQSGVSLIPSHLKSLDRFQQRTLVD